MAETQLRAFTLKPGKRDPFERISKIDVKDRYLSGYTKASEALYRAFTVLLSLFFIVITLPLSITICLSLVLLDGFPLFYRSLRLGKDKKLFQMLKFRTLVSHSDKHLGAQIFTEKVLTNRALLTRTGGFLRDTRLDELPQFFNTLKGDMDLLGPRPLRPEVYEKSCMFIKNFDHRFTVKPGLVGYSQLFTPHSAPKKIRNLIDNRFLRKNHSYSKEVVLILLSFGLLFVRMLYTLFSTALHHGRLILLGQKEKRCLSRVSLHDASLSIRPAGGAVGDSPVRGIIKDINESAICVITDAELPGEELLLRMEMKHRKRSKMRTVTKTARCRGHVYLRKELRDKNGDFCYVINYDPVSPFNFYIVNQYFIQGSIVRT